MRRWCLTAILIIGCAASTPAVEPAAIHVRLGEVLRVVAEEYEARERVEPVRMLLGALQAAGEDVPALLYEHLDDGRGGELLVHMGDQATRYSLAKLGSLAQLEALLGRIVAQIEAALPGEQRPGRLEAVFAAGMLRALDGHSALLSAAAYGDFQSKASGRIGGLGMLLARRERHLTVDSVLPGSPAAQAGVLRGDRILQIGDRAALHLPLEDALALVRGRVGTLVSLLILRPR
jgi:hypothetical protein